MSTINPLGQGNNEFGQGGSTPEEVFIEPPKNKSPLKLAKKRQKSEVEIPVHQHKQINHEVNNIVTEKTEVQTPEALTTKCPACGEINAASSDFCWKCSHSLREKVKKSFRITKPLVLLAIAIPLTIFFISTFKSTTKTQPWNKLSNEKYLKLKAYRAQIPIQVTNPPEKILEGEWLGLWNKKKSFHLLIYANYPSAYNTYTEDAIKVDYAVEGRVAGKGNVKVINFYPTSKVRQTGKFNNGDILTQDFVISQVQGEPGIMHIKARIDGKIRETFIYKISNAETDNSQWGERVEWFSAVKLIEKDDKLLSFDDIYTLAKIGVNGGHDYYDIKVHESNGQIHVNTGLNGDIGLPGFKIYGVEKGSAAQTAGLKVGDRIISVNGHELESHLHWLQLVRIKKPGDVLNLVVNRDGRPFKVAIKMHL